MLPSLETPNQIEPSPEIVAIDFAFADLVQLMQTATPEGRVEIARRYGNVITTLEKLLREIINAAQS